jgi:uncharacterized protein (TIGR01244 family)
MNNPLSQKRKFLKKIFGRYRRVCSLLAAIGLVIGVGIYTYQSLFVGHFGVVVEGKLYRSRQPTGLQFSVLFHCHGIKRVINLQSPMEDPDRFSEEKRICRREGVDFVNLPIMLEEPPLSQVEEFLRLVDTSPGPILIHCDCGRNRSGMMSAVYRVARQGVPVERAIQEELTAYDAKPVGRKRKLIVKLLEQFTPTTHASSREGKRPYASFLVRNKSDW